MFADLPGDDPGLTRIARRIIEPGGELKSRYGHFQSRALHLSALLPAPALPPDDSAAPAGPQRAGS